MLTGSLKLTAVFVANPLLSLKLKAVSVADKLVKTTVDTLVKTLA